MVLRRPQWSVWVVGSNCVAAFVAQQCTTPRAITLQCFLRAIFCRFCVLRRCQAKAKKRQLTLKRLDRFRCSCTLKNQRRCFQTLSSEAANSSSNKVRILSRLKKKEYRLRNIASKCQLEVMYSYLLYLQSNVYLRNDHSLLLLDCSLHVIKHQLQDWCSFADVWQKKQSP